MPIALLSRKGSVIGPHGAGWSQTGSTQPLGECVHCLDVSQTRSRSEPHAAQTSYSSDTSRIFTFARNI